MRAACLSLFALLLTVTGQQTTSAPENSTTPSSSSPPPPSQSSGLLSSLYGKAKDATSKAAGKIGRFAATKSTDEEICFDALGCLSLKSPWVSFSRPFPKPSSPEKINTRFYFYSRETEGRYNVTTFPEIELNGSNYRGDRPTFFIVHGFSSDGNATWLSDLKDALLEKVDSNVFLVDWGDGASDGTYFQVAANTRIVGAEVSRLGKFLIAEKGAQPQDFHFFGHSLGAQISSYAAKNITNVGRITAMDPAQPGFENLDKVVRIDSSDAHFVDAIHTNGKPTIPFLGFGMIRPVGDVDFYMNGGVDQPNCEVPKLDTLKSFSDLASIPITVVGKLVSCSHGRSYEYVTEAIQGKCRMWGHKVNLAQRILNVGSIGHLGVLTTSGKCKVGECTPLGLDTPKYPARGTFSVGTAPDKPYCVRETSDDGQDAKELEMLGALSNNTTGAPPETTTTASKISRLVPSFG